MKYFVSDTETSGLPSFKLPSDDPSQPRIIQIAGALFELGNDEPLATFRRKVKPDGWQMDDELAAKMGHGLTHAVLEAEGSPIAEALENWTTLHDAADLLVGYNFAFDQKMLRGELRRAGMDDRYGAKPTFDVQPHCTKLCKLPPTDAMMATGRKTFKTAKLSEAVEILLGEKLEGAHDALHDVRATARLFRLVYSPELVKAAPTPRAATPAPKPDLAVEEVPGFLA